MSSSCPHCASNLIYEKNSRMYERTIGVEVRGVYDGVLFWQCPDCAGRWHRWPEQHPYRELAERYI